MKHCYIAGPMRGIPQFNYPLFDAVAEGLRDEGWMVINPAELDAPEVRAEALASPDGYWEEGGLIGGKSFGDVLGEDIRELLNNCNGILLLPGWQGSQGARLEAFAAVNAGMLVREYIPHAKFNDPCFARIETRTSLWVLLELLRAMEEA